MPEVKVMVSLRARVRLAGAIPEVELLPLKVTPEPH